MARAFVDEYKSTAIASDGLLVALRIYQDLIYPSMFCVVKGLGRTVAMQIGTSPRTMGFSRPPAPPAMIRSAQIRDSRETGGFSGPLPWRRVQTGCTLRQP
jgi:hypothetical protein